MSNARNLARVLADNSGAIAATNLANAVPADGSITTAKLAANAVTDVKIAGVAASKLSGVLPDANAPSGSVIQVVQTVNNTTATFVRNEYISYLQTSITPSSTSSKILVCINFGGLSADSAADGGIIIYRGGTELAVGSGAYNTLATFIPYMNLSNGDLVSSSFMYLDSPSTTSALSYKFMCAINSGRTMFYNRRGVANDFSCSSSVILMEIAG